MDEIGLAKEVASLATQRGKPSAWRAVRENAEAVIIAVVLALIIRHFTVQAFEIPTGSMAPTLYGDHRPQVCPECNWEFSIGASRISSGLRPHVPAEVICPNCHNRFGPQETFTSGNKILVNKFRYAFTEPQRWDVIVFKFPVEPWKDYIKRLVGLPGEELAIRQGDIYINGKILRKDDDIQKGLWFPVFDMRYMPKNENMNPWRGNCDPGWTVGNDRLEVETSGRATAGFKKYCFDPEKSRKNPAIRFRTGYNPVGFEKYKEDTPISDAKVAFEIMPLKAGGAFEVIIREGRENGDIEHRFVLKIEGEGGDPTGLYRHQKPLRVDENIKIPVSKTAKIACVNSDDRMQLWIDGEKVLEFDYDDAEPTSEYDEVEDVALEFAAEDAKAVITQVAVHRDLYHSREWGPEKVPEGYYFVLGDNTMNSTDSRSHEWTFLPKENLVGGAFMIFWKPWEIKLIK